MIQLQSPSPKRRAIAQIAMGVALLAVAGTSTAVNAQAAAQKQQVSFPMPVDLGLQVMEVRQFGQMQTVGQFDVFYGFQFSDERVASGIDFETRVVEDASKAYKAVHYDHGNGIAVADVDGDGLLDIYFTTQLGDNELWKNNGDGTFANITETAGVALGNKISVAGSFGDIDNDGDPDLYVTTVKMGNHLFVNDGKGVFEDVTSEAGLEMTAHSSGSVFFDYDRDGDLDLFVTNVGQYTGDDRGPGGYFIGYPDAFSGHLFPERTENSVLYRNLGNGRFEDASQSTGLVDGSWSGDATFTDFDGDNDPDIFVLNMQGDDHYWENQDGHFVDRSAALFPRTPWGTMGIKFFDWDNDSRMDLMLSDMHSDMSREVTPGFEKLKAVMIWGEEYLGPGDNNIFGNAFYQNRGEGKFEEISDSIGAENYWPWGLTVADLNADGWQDIMLTSSMNFPYRYGINTILLNNKGKKFLDSEFILGIEPRKGESKKPWFDLDCNAADRGHRLCGGRTGEYTILGSLGSRTAAIFDLDGDGDLDIVTNEFNGPPMVLISNLSDKKPIHYLSVKLQGTESNRDGLGARVTVRAGEQSWVKYHDGKSGYLSQSSMPLYFGLGDATKVDSIEVLWPSGREQRVSENIPVGALIEIEEK